MKKLYVLLALLLSYSVHAQRKLHKDDYSNLLSEQLGAKVISYSSEDTTFKAHNIINDKLEKGAVWRMHPIKGNADPHWVTIELYQEKEVTTFAFCSDKLNHQECLGVAPVFVEIHISTQGPDKGFTKVGELHLKQYGDQQMVRIEPAKVKWVKLFFHGNWGCKNFTEIGRIYAYNDVLIEGYEATLAEEGLLEVHDIYFESNSSDFAKGSLHSVQMIAEILIDNPNMKLKIEGHTDNEGSADHNMELSKKRAQHILKTLVGLGIDEKRLLAEGFGATMPIADNATPEGKATNRRVTFRVIE